MRGLCAIRAQSMLNAACSRRSGKSVVLQKLSSGSSRRLSGLFGDFTLELAHLERQLVFARLQEPIVEAADVLDGAQAMGGHPQLDALAERIRHQSHVLQV